MSSSSGLIEVTVLSPWYEILMSFNSIILLLKRKRISCMSSNTNLLDNGYNVYNMPGMTFYRGGSYRMQLIPKRLLCVEPWNLLIGWDLQHPSLCLRWTNCQILLTGPICTMAEREAVNLSRVEATCNMQLQDREDTPET